MSVVDKVYLNYDFEPVSREEATLVKAVMDDGRVVFGFPVEEGEKGGPGSGHHGHSGRPGVRGGSVPGTSRAGMADPTADVVRSLCRGIESDDIAQVVEAYRGIPPEHFDGLKGITDDGEPEAIELESLDSFMVIGGPDEPLFGTCSGYYYPRDREIHVHKKHWGTPTPIHELGHHFLIEFPEKVDQKGLTSTLEAFRQVWQPHLDLIGLRPYSLRSTNELFADIYAVWARGKEHQYKSLG